MFVTDPSYVQLTVIPDTVTTFVAESPWFVVVVIDAIPVASLYANVLTASVELSDFVTTPPLT